MGVVYFGLNPFELRRLDRFEGSEYRRQTEAVILSGGKVVPACVYVWRMERVSRLSRQPWDLPQFSRSPEFAGFSTNRMRYPK